jgi:hypothetical protein
MSNRLNDWLEKTGTKRADFAKAIGVVPSYITLLCSDEPAWPGRDIATKIRDVTGGAVTADDFLPPSVVPTEAA